MKAIDTQVGGDHYKKFKIQPVEYIHANDLDFMQGNIVKYISRHKFKKGKEDVLKAIHFCHLILELQYGEGKSSDDSMGNISAAIVGTMPKPPIPPGQCIADLIKDFADKQSPRRG